MYKPFQIIGHISSQQLAWRIVPCNVITDPEETVLKSDERKGV